MALPPAPDVAERTRIFRSLVPYFGTVQPSAFFQKTAVLIPGVERVHHFIEGIYKPANSAYTLSISSMLKSPYHDEVFFNPDRTWWMNYSSKKRYERQPCSLHDRWPAGTRAATSVR